MKSHNFRNLKVYQRSIEFAVKIYKLSNIFPKEELYGLASQIRRAVISISLNIAEGSANKSKKEFQKFLHISLGSVYEVIASLEIALKLDYCKKENFDKLLLEADEIAAMIFGFSKSLSSDL